MACLLTSISIVGTILALNKGAKMGEFAHDTGEGSIAVPIEITSARIDDKRVLNILGGLSAQEQGASDRRDGNTAG